jgi:hypothetical protein
MRQGQRHTGNFAHAVWGGKALALVAARRFRDELLLRLEPDTRVRRQVPRGARGTTGVVGVTIEPHRVGGRVYERYVARWKDPDSGVRRRRFSIKGYGKDRAFALAVEAREAGVARCRAVELARQREEAARRLQEAPPMPARAKHPLSRKGIRMPRRHPRAK